MDKLLRESGIPYEKINYYTEPLSKKKLTELLRKMNLKPRDLLRKSEAVYKELTSNLIRNSHMVAAGIVAVNRAQERGYTFANAG